TDNAGGRFAIDSGTGVVTVLDASLLNYESATSHTITVQATDGTTPSTTQNFSIAVTNVAPTTPTDSDGATGGSIQATGVSNGDAVGITAHSTDVNGGTLTYSLTNSAGGLFAINSSTGVVTVANAAGLGASSYTITARASDGTAFSGTQDFTITVNH